MEEIRNITRRTFATAREMEGPLPLSSPLALLITSSVLTLAVLLVIMTRKRHAVRASPRHCISRAWQAHGTAPPVYGTVLSNTYGFLLNQYATVRKAFQSARRAPLRALTLCVGG